LARLELSLIPAAATLTLDGRPTPSSPAVPLVLDPGPHQLRVHAAGHRDYTANLELASGQALSFAISLAPEPAALQQSAAALPQPPGAPFLPARSSEPESDRARHWAYWLGAGSLALGAGAVLVRVESDHQYAAWVRNRAALLGAGYPERPASPNIWAKGRSLERSVRALDRTTWGLGLGSAALLGVAAWLYWTDSAGATVTDAAFALEVDASTLRVRGSF
jgi:hypothetical protein